MKCYKTISRHHLTAILYNTNNLSETYLNMEEKIFTCNNDWISINQNSTWPGPSLAIMMSSNFTPSGFFENSGRES